MVSLARSHFLFGIIHGEYSEAFFVRKLKTSVATCTYKLVGKCLVRVISLPYLEPRLVFGQ